ncbi:hypothetical protein Ccar_23390 [Clostridium carboxidivorans P7]|uniref:Spore coat protein GerQ n=1 Tax=Clostridium carboxidivorans P7 TaxID=536227 RepID=C6PNB0_9CLOT|nr:hypothetical protein [Clostridium carboxidivorans]AKN33603.1 hypothetical protein Ccar_23390 [Clostridium carboxidivorans P7]EET89231.1 hypothetical protein CcarbDRAFT_0277 [Clostridium carboxidivorans P7]EFG86808.1 hypothetical protein CLCAR_3765 [Clostridium carboxidivorans P7]
MFPQYCFNCFNPYAIDYDSPNILGFRQQKKPVPQFQGQQPQQQPIMQDQGFEQAPGSPIAQDIQYTQGYLRTQIGKRVRVFFLIGTNIVQDREGILEDVGISYIILKETGTNINVLCDIYAIKFVNIFP